jgi:hypothetical protein
MHLHRADTIHFTVMRGILLTLDVFGTGRAAIAWEQTADPTIRVLL